MKKLLFIFAFIFIFSFAFACGEKEDEKKQDDNKQEEQKPDEPKDEPEEPETKEFTVKFVVDGEKTILKVVEGEKANKPSDPVKDGYKFIGWFVGSEEYDIAGSVDGLFIDKQTNKLILADYKTNTYITGLNKEPFIKSFDIEFFSSSNFWRYNTMTFWICSFSSGVNPITRLLITLLRSSSPCSSKDLAFCFS